METRDFVWFVIIVGVVIGSIYLLIDPSFPIQQGLDLQGGFQVLLEADLPPDVEVTDDQMQSARQIISRRVGGLGVSEPLVQASGDRRIVVELPGLEDESTALSLIQETALLEFVDSGQIPLQEGACIRTTENNGDPSPCELEDGSLEGSQIYETVITGASLISANAVTDLARPPGQQNFVVFTFDEEGGDIFGTYTSTNLGEFLTIVLDKRVISSPRIQATISREGTITGDFTPEEANRLALSLRFGSLPIPLTVVGNRQVGATLGAQSIQASIQAGAIGLIVVLLFMLIYYRLPGGLADIALVVYALINIALYKLIGVTMTLPAIAGFLLSTGMAVDANILVFERMKEELRDDALLEDATRSGFSRAWSSIRDSNIATIVVCMILLIFGRSFGAAMVQGFAITLMIGVAVSMFTAVIVTRTLVMLVMNPLAEWLEDKKWLLGL
ncbi:MAG: protein translocase subunit SecD [Chloroflexota bacterium]